MKKKIIITVIAIIAMVILLLILGAIGPWFISVKTVVNNIDTKELELVKDADINVKMEYVGNDPAPEKDRIAKSIGKVEGQLKTKGNMFAGNLNSNVIIKSDSKERPIDINVLMKQKNKMVEIVMAENGEMTKSKYGSIEEASLGLGYLQIRKEGERLNLMKDLRSKDFKPKINKFLSSNKVKVTSTPKPFKKHFKIETKYKDLSEFIDNLMVNSRENRISMYKMQLDLMFSGKVILEFDVDPYNKELSDLVITYLPKEDEVQVKFIIKLDINNGTDVPDIPKDLNRKKVDDIEELVNYVIEDSEVKKAISTFEDFLSSIYANQYDYKSLIQYFKATGLDIDEEAYLEQIKEYNKERLNSPSQSNTNHKPAIDTNSNNSSNTNRNTSPYTNYNNNRNQNINTNQNQSITQKPNNNSYYNQNRTQNQNRANSNVNNNANGINSNNYNNNVNTNMNTNTNSISNGQTTNNNANTQNPNNGIYNYIYGNQ